MPGKQRALRQQSGLQTFGTVQVHHDSVLNALFSTLQHDKVTIYPAFTSPSAKRQNREECTGGAGRRHWERDPSWSSKENSLPNSDVSIPKGNLKRCPEPEDFRQQTLCVQCADIVSHGKKIKIAITFLKSPELPMEVGSQIISSTTSLVFLMIQGT